MKVVFDIEANALHNPTQIWVVVCKDIDTGQRYIFRHLTDDKGQREEFLEFAEDVRRWIGHNILEYDFPVLVKLGILRDIPLDRCIDTCIISKLVNYERPGGHSVEQYGIEFGLEKGKFNDWAKYSDDMVSYCIRDVDITDRIYKLYDGIVGDPAWHSAIGLEQRFQLIVNDLSANGFCFNSTGARSLLEQVTKDLTILDEQILSAFPPREVLIREFTPKLTKFGTISRSSVPRILHSEIHKYEGGKAYRHTRLEPFNPSSHKQLIQVLNEAGWKPENKTQTHIDTERAILQMKKNKTFADLPLYEEKLKKLKVTGWKVEEENLSTLPPTAPEPARLLAKRILLEARRRSLTEWLSLVNFEIKINKESVGCVGTTKSGQQIPLGAKGLRQEKEIGLTPFQKKNEQNGTEEIITNILTDSRSKNLIEWLKNKKVSVSFVKESKNYLWITITGQDRLEDFYAILATEALVGTNPKLLQYEVTSTRINGRFNGLGSWTGRMNHQKPNTANIPREFKEDGTLKLLGKEMRELWCAPHDRLLVGVDAEGIQLRIFAHYIDDKEFTDALVNGKKSDKSDPHSLNQRILGSVCKTRQAAKRFVYALLLGGGLGKLAFILGCSQLEARKALDRLLERYEGFARLKRTQIPKDAKAGFFVGLDGRLVPIRGDTQRDREHHAMSGYLQNGEKIIMARAAIIIDDRMAIEKVRRDWFFVNIVHDELQSEVKKDMDFAIECAKIQAEAIAEAGRYYHLKCPMAGSYYNEDIKDYTIGQDWYRTH